MNDGLNIIFLSFYTHLKDKIMIKF